MQTYDRNFFEDCRAEALSSARVVVPLVLELVQPKSVIDVGCGEGVWLSVFREYGVENVSGVDGHYVDKGKLEIPTECFRPWDLRQPLKIEEKFDLVVSLEVAEHLPRECSKTFVQSLTDLGSVVLFSAAVPFQGGTNHVNEQWPEYWIQLFRAAGFLSVDCLRPRLWLNEEVAWWYRQNMFFFVDRSKVESYPKLNTEYEARGRLPTSLVHPKAYLRWVDECARQKELAQYLRQIAEELGAVIPVSDSFVLVDENQWEPWAVPTGRRGIPFIERNGQYWGPPPDDDTAVSELKRLQRGGANFIAFACPAFWWLEHYVGFRRWLDSEFACVLKNDRLVVYDLRDRSAKSALNLQLKTCEPAPFPAGAALKCSGTHPLVSIVINNYNYGHFLKEAIDSALNQTYARVEVIVVDDGSTDHSRKVIASFGNRVMPVYKDNGGQGSTYNAGFMASHGDFICYLDADDTLHRIAMETAAQLFEAPGTVKVQWPLVVIDKAGRPTGELSTKRTPPDGDLRKRVLREGPIYDFLFTTGSAYSRFFLEKVLPMPEPPYRNGADVYLITLAPIFGRLHTSAEPLGTYRSHGANNYRGRVLDDERVKNYLSRFEMNCSVLHEHLAKLGIQAEPEQWRRQNFNCVWPKRLLAAKQDLAALIPRGTSYILVNQDEWGEGEPLAGRHAIPFLERGGEYFGPPADDASAIAELERLRSADARYIVFWWTAFWWLEHYDVFHQRLRTSFQCVLENDRLVVFDLHYPTT